ncbi:hypothetical protein F5051DRAFT_456529 [Lentinula edodes]|nr:hypothetical protein F5051DRAFT_456529 [Lentinula edodes]
MSLFNLTQLPDDILFHVCNFLSSPGILELRKTCKRLHDLTLERTIWTNAYRNFGYFLPPGPSASQTVHELERVLLHAHQWDTIWAIPALLRTRDHRSLKISVPKIRSLALYQGKYLAIGTLESLILYDLQAEKEIYRHNIPTKPFWLQCRNDITDSNANLYIPFGRESGNNTTSLQLCICKVDSLGNTTFDDIPGVEITYDCIASVGYDFFVTSQHSGETVLLHILSQKIYIINAASGTSEGHITNVIFMPTYVLLVYTHYVNMQERKYFELYSLPDPMSEEAGARVLPTHSGNLSMHFSEASFFSSDTSVDGHEIIWLVVLAGIQLWALRITLQPDGSMTFHSPDYDTYRFAQRTMVHGFDLAFTVTGTASSTRNPCGRGISRFATPKISWLKYDVHRGADGRISTKSAVLDNRILPSFILYDFDAFRGLICGTTDSEEIIVMDFVS